MTRLLARVIQRMFRQPDPSDRRLLAGLWLLWAAITLLAVVLVSGRASALPLSSGDRIQVTLPDDEEFTGAYLVDVDGSIQLPYVGAVPLRGLDPAAAEGTIAAALEAREMYQGGAARVVVQVLEWAPIEIPVAGAVFSPGKVWLNVPAPEDRPAAGDRAPGASSARRSLSDALKAAGGIRPDADLARVRVERAGQLTEHDLRGIIDGLPATDVPLTEGDRVVVPSTGLLDPALARPSRITPPGIKIFASNLTQPATSNANSNAPSSGISLPYGSRLSQAVIAANCAGGARVSNSSRAAVLVRTDRTSGVARATRHPLAQVFTASAEADNPVLLEGDALYCADSAITNAREIFRTVTELLLPFNLRRWR